MTRHNIVVDVVGIAIALAAYLVLATRGEIVRWVVQ
jgi:hypothetical protein